VASKRELVEAHSYNRRRLVTAFLSGAPGGREVEPAKPGRAVVVGAVLAVLVVVGAAVFGFLRPGLRDDWDQDKLIVSKDTAARYVVLGDGVLHPVLNAASARLLLPEGGFEVLLVPSSELADKRIGETVGIDGAPDTLPEPDALVQSGWTSCLDGDQRTLLQLARDPGATPTGEGAAQVVTVNDQTWVLWSQGRYLVPADATTAVLRPLGLDGVAPVPVPGSWLDLFPELDPLAPLGVDGDGTPYGGAGADGAAVGTVYEVGAGTSARRYLLTADGLAELTDVAWQLRQVASAAAPVTATQADIAAIPTAPAPYPGSWPSVVPEPFPGPVTCALLTSGPGTAPVVALAVPGEQPAPDGAAGVQVDRGSGAVVRAVSGSSTEGTVYLVDATGTRYALDPGAEEVAGRLGYGTVDPALVPVAWVEALGDGPALSVEAAEVVAEGG
jgi:type VII secretion protein EccB